MQSCCMQFIILEGYNLSRLFPGTSLNWIRVHVDSMHFFWFVNCSNCSTDHCLVERSSNYFLLFRCSKLTTFHVHALKKKRKKYILICEKKIILLAAGGVLATILVFLSILFVGTVDRVGFYPSVLR